MRLKVHTLEREAAKKLNGGDFWYCKRKGLRARWFLPIKFTDKDRVAEYCSILTTEKWSVKGNVVCATKRMA